jgi:hypothetical protein
VKTKIEEMKAEFSSNDDPTSFLPHADTHNHRAMASLKGLILALNGMAIDGKRRLEIDKSLVLTLWRHANASLHHRCRWCTLDTRHDF